jgi:hypothetical protein
MAHAQYSCVLKVLLLQVWMPRTCAHPSTAPIAVFRRPVAQTRNQLNSGFGCGELRAHGDEICVVSKAKIDRTTFACFVWKIVKRASV